MQGSLLDIKPHFDCATVAVQADRTQINTLFITCFMRQGLRIKQPCSGIHLCLNLIPLKGRGVFWVRAGQAPGVWRGDP